MTDRLDLKYRPRKFAQVLGNGGVVDLLLKRSRNGTLSTQSMMFGGPKGCGKTTIARIAARAILCPDLDDGEPCGECHACNTVLNESSEDVEEMDAASQGTVDRVRSMVRDTDYEGKRVYLLDEAHRLTPQAQDALLKPVEDGLFTIILCTTEPHKVRAPIRDRVEEYSIYPPSAEAMEARLADICAQEGIQADPEALKIVVSMSKCHPRRCLMTVGTLALGGSLTKESAKAHFRYDSYTAIGKVLSLLDQDPRKAFEALDVLAAKESPTWIRDQVVAAISSAMRVDVGAKATYPVPTHFFQNRLHGWSEVSRAFVLLDKPTMADVESMLLSSLPAMRSSTPARPVPPEPEPVPEPEPEPVPVTPPVSAVSGAPEILPAPPPEKPKPPPEKPSLVPSTPPVRSVSAPSPDSKPVELDGVTFSPEEKLTSLDSKVGLPTKPETPDAPAPVEFNRDHAPITDKEFSRGLLSRLRGPRQ